MEEASNRVELNVGEIENDYKTRLQKMHAQMQKVFHGTNQRR